MRLRLSPSVPSDLQAISAFIAANSPRYAYITLLKIREKIKRVAQNPYLYQLRTKIGPGLRVATVGSYLILFRVAGESVLIERVVHGSRELRNLSKVDEED
jgi:toxin ParE1/3/4